jgi:hypothetical protein
LKRIDEACREPYTGEPKDTRIIVTGLMKKLQVEIQGDGRVVDEALGAYA